VPGVVAELVPGSVDVGGRDREARRARDMVDQPVLHGVADPDVDPVPTGHEAEVVDAHEDILELGAIVAVHRRLHARVE